MYSETPSPARPTTLIPLGSTPAAGSVHDHHQVTSPRAGSSPALSPSPSKAPKSPPAGAAPSPSCPASSNSVLLVSTHADITQPLSSRFETDISLAVSTCDDTGTVEVNLPRLLPEGPTTSSTGSKLAGFATIIFPPRQPLFTPAGIQCSTPSNKQYLPTFLIGSASSPTPREKLSTVASPQVPEAATAAVTSQHTSPISPTSPHQQHIARVNSSPKTSASRKLLATQTSHPITSSPALNASVIPTTVYETFRQHSSKENHQNPARGLALGKSSFPVHTSSACVNISTNSRSLTQTFPSNTEAKHKFPFPKTASTNITQASYTQNIPYTTASAVHGVGADTVQSTDLPPALNSLEELCSDIQTFDFARDYHQSSPDLPTRRLSIPGDDVFMSVCDTHPTTNSSTTSPINCFTESSPSFHSTASNHYLTYVTNPEPNFPESSATTVSSVLPSFSVFTDSTSAAHLNSISCTQLQSARNTNKLFYPSVLNESGPDFGLYRSDNVHSYGSVSSISSSSIDNGSGRLLSGSSDASCNSMDMDYTDEEALSYTNLLPPWSDEGIQDSLTIDDSADIFNEANAMKILFSDAIIMQGIKSEPFDHFPDIDDTDPFPRIESPDLDSDGTGYESSSTDHGAPQYTELEEPTYEFFDNSSPSFVGNFSSSKSFTSDNFSKSSFPSSTHPAHSSMQTSCDSDQGFSEGYAVTEDNLPDFGKLQDTSVEEAEEPVPCRRRSESSSPKEKKAKQSRESPALSDKSSSSDRKKPGRKKGQVSNVLHLWEFMRDLLKDPKWCGEIIEWISVKEGVFRVTNSSEVARLWGEKKKNKKEMTYEKLSRSLRYSRLEGYFSDLPKDKNYPKKLCFKFGPKSKDW